MTEKIENMLSELISLMPEDEYSTFLASNNLILIYDKVLTLGENADDILNESTLAKVYDIVSKQLDAYK